MLILKYPETDQPFINLSVGDYKEKHYTTEQITQYFVEGLNSIVKIFDEFDNTYKTKVQEDVIKNNINTEGEFLVILSEISKFLKLVLQNPLNKDLYDTFLRMKNSLEWDYAGYGDDEDYESPKKVDYERYLRTQGINLEEYYMDDDLKYKKMIQEDVYFKDFKSISLLKYGQFLSSMANHIYCYLCLYYENLKKKYYFRFEHLYRDVYQYSYFTRLKNPDLLKTDKQILEYTDHCTSLEKLLEMWGKNERNK